MKNIKRIYNNTTAMKALEDVNEDLAIKVISDPNLDGEELSEILEASMMGKIVNKNSKQPMKLSNKVLMAGLLNKFQQFERDNIKKPSID